MYYGKFGLVSLTKDESNLKYGDYDRKGVKLSGIVAAHRKSLWNSYISTWRMISISVLGKPKNIFSVSRRIEAMYLDDMFPNIHRDEKIWKKYLDKIQDKCDNDWNNLKATSRQSSVRLVVALRPGQPFTTFIVNVFARMWSWLDYPTKQGSSTVNRFFIFTSSIPGKTIKEKSRYLATLPSYQFTKFALIADDISFIDMIRLCKKWKMRASFDFKKIRSEDGSRISIKSKEWKYLEATWRDGSGNSIMMPVVFTTDPFHKKMDKLVKHYSRRASVVFYEGANK